MLCSSAFNPDNPERNSSFTISAFTAFASNWRRFPSVTLPAAGRRGKYRPRSMVDIDRDKLLSHGCLTPLDIVNAVNTQ